MLHLDGLVPAYLNINTLTLSAFINGQEVAQTRLGTGPFTWDVPLNTLNQGRSFRLKLVSDAFVIPKKINPRSSDERQIAIMVSSLTINGLSPEHTLVPVSITEKAFRREGSKAIGTVFVPEDARRVQLPALFYPDLLDVRVNGQKVPYFAVPHTRYSLVGLQLAPGTYTVSVSFTGLRWANWVSSMAWLFMISAWGITAIRERRTRPILVVDRQLS